MLVSSLEIILVVGICGLESACKGCELLGFYLYFVKCMMVVLENKVA